MDPEVFRAPDRLPDQILRITEVGCYLVFRMTEVGRYIHHQSSLLHINNYVSIAECGVTYLFCTARLVPEKVSESTLLHRYRFVWYALVPQKLNLEFPVLLRYLILEYNKILKFLSIVSHII